MQVLLDQNPCDVQATTVGEAVDAAAALARDQGRMIVEISVDGVTWPETHLASPQQLGAAAEVVALTTAEPATLVRQVFSDAAEALADADTLQREAAESLQADEQIVAMDKLNEAISIWLSVHDAIVKGTEVMELDLDGITVRDVPITMSIQRLDEQLQMVRDSLENGDQIGLADALLYEFPQVVEEWQRLLDCLNNRIQENA